jgi:hypothetical protein
MKPIRILLSILCTCFASVAWSQQTTCTAHTPWVEFHRYSMRRSNPREKVLDVTSVANLELKWSYKAVGGSVLLARRGERGGVCRLG